jgi:hypothetical protein
MTEEVDYYAVLGLPPSADDATIRLAYRRLARRYHPDIAGDENLHLMQTLNQAYQTLSDPERRRVYDASRPLLATDTESFQTAQQPQQRSQQQAHPPTPTTPTPTPTARRLESVTASPGPLRRLSVFDDGLESAVVSVALAQGGAVAAVGHIDGHVVLWDSRQARSTARLALGRPGQAGTLSEVRISHDAALVVAWGFSLGLGVWHVGDSARRWSSQMNAPSGLMDAVFLPHPAGLLRLALPDAPQTLSENDPFAWADRGRGGTAVYTRPLPERGPINPGWATPLRCYDAPTGRQKRSEAAPWQIRERVLSADGRRLLTLSTGRPDGRPRSQILRLWDIEARSHRGNVEPRRIAEVIEPDGRLTFPLATSPDLAVVALADFQGHVQIRSLDDHVRRSVTTGPVPLDAFAVLTADAALLALAHGQRLDLWDTRTGQHLQQWHLTSPLTALSFAPVAHPTLALGLPNGLTEIWG